jgi:hypothetical protein
MEEIFSALLIIGYGTVVYKFYKFVRKREKKASEMYFQNVYSSVLALADKVRRIQELENLITDIECCSKNYLKAVRIDVPDSLAGISRHDFIISGDDDNSKHLLDIALSEREKLRASLLDDLQEISHNGVTKTITKTTVQNGDRGVDESG